MPDTKTPEHITAAAIRVASGATWTGMRHESARERALIAGDLSRGLESGFLTNTGRFVDRAEAMKIAVAAGQVPSNLGTVDLYSEDLW